jgi:uncharacterized protein (DUF4415 family)
MKSKKPDPELIDEENPEWTVENINRARPAAEVLPKYIGQKATDELLAGSRSGPHKRDRKANQTLRIDQDVLEAYKEEGTGWQTRINRVLKPAPPRVRCRPTKRR